MISNKALELSIDKNSNTSIKIYLHSNEGTENSQESLQRMPSLYQMDYNFMEAPQKSMSHKKGTNIKA